MSTQLNQLTKFPSGSLKEIAIISFPLMLNALSVNLMLFFDRLILSQYHVDAMTAAAGAGMVFAIFQFGGMGITSIAEVFVGQHNGAGHYDKIGVPVWQMVWFSVFLNVIYWPAGFLLGEVLIAPPLIEHGLDYFEVLMMFAFIFPMLVAISSFYIGRGQVKIVTFAAVIGNILNVGLDYILVLGIDGVIEPMGTIGAAIGTVIASAVNLMIMFVPFLLLKSNKRFGTLNAKFNWPVMKQCLQVGLPTAIGHTIEITGWSLLVYLVASKSKDYMVVFTIAQTFFIIYAFITDGLQKGVTAVVANFIGGKHTQYITKTLISSIKLLCLMELSLLLPYLLFPDVFIGLFLDDKANNSFLWEHTKLAILGAVIEFGICGMTWVLGGVLTAGGDTKYIMWVNILGVWLTGILPSYIWLTYFPSTPSSIYLYIFPCSALINFGLMFWRYKSKKWIKVDLSRAHASA